MSRLSWTEALRVLFTTPMVPAVPSEPAEIAMADLSPATSIRSSVDSAMSIDRARSMPTRYSLSTERSASPAAFEFRDE